MSDKQAKPQVVENERVKILRDQGILFLSDNVNDVTFAELSKDLISTAQAFLARTNKLQKSPVWVVLNSRGGYIHDGFAIYDIVNGYVKRGLQVNILGLGRVASMAAVIIQAASPGGRYSMSHTQFGIHQASRSSPDEDEEVNMARERVEELERVNRISMGIIAERSGMGLEELLKISKKTDKWYSADEAVKFGKHGLIDKILFKMPF